MHCIDNLQFANWSEKIFLQMREGGVDAVHVTIAYHVAPPCTEVVARWLASSVLELWLAGWTAYLYISVYMYIYIYIYLCIFTAGGAGGAGHLRPEGADVRAR